MKPIIILTLSILMASLAYSQTNLLAGECRQLNYTIFNSTNNETFWGQDNTCCQEQTVNVTNPVYLNLSLNSGERRQGVTENCNYDFTCQYVQCPATGSRCSRTKGLDAGETWDLNDTSCDLHFSCEKQDKNTCTDDVIKQEIYIDVERDGDTIRLSNGNETQLLTTNSSKFSNSFKFDISCPVVYQGTDGPVNETSNIAWTYQNCKQWVDFFDQRNFIAYDTFAKYMADGQKSNLDFASGVMAGEEQFRSQLVSCQQNQVNMQQSISSMQQQLQDMQTLEKENKELKNDQMLFFIMLGFFGMYFLVTLILYIKNGGFDKGVHVE